MELGELFAFVLTPILKYGGSHSDSIGSSGNYFYYSKPEIEMDDAVYIPIRNYEHLAVYNNEVKGFWLSASNYLMPNDTTVK